ncbi:MAG: transporter substrate-binding domain-containing protein, partial [Atopostipes sp.]|nr:transporter substrate-binding domain-containing protein [Atopostipes sp.]
MKKIMTILGLFTLLIFTACTGETVEQKDDSLEVILDEEVFVLGHTDYPPFGMRDNGKSIGFDIDMADELTNRLGVSLETKYIDWDSKQFELDNKNIDAIWNGFTITPAREKEVTFTEPYFNNHIVIMSLKGNSYESLEDLENKKVGVELQSSGQIAIEERKDINTSLEEMMKYSSVSEALMALKTGGVDVIVVDENFARYVASEDSNQYEISEARFNPENYGIGLRKGSNKLAEKIDEIIDEM